ncbi:oligosaccharide flippase family protein [Saccharicrinis aurantiacus]|uniref:oligosaccharide flippase family protein n=1 Tax=Saccharicrinis aurantiacus TaxID=1849719 RepID=UPI0031E8A701
MPNMIQLSLKRISEEQIFMASVILVNGGNYLYNLLLGRILGPAEFANAALQITLLLILSFLGMTFQLTTARFAVEQENKNWIAQRHFLIVVSSIAGIIIGVLLIIFSSLLQTTFHTQTKLVFILLGIGVPLYFIMSVIRGTYQGKQAFKKLSISYQSEMLSRLVITLSLLYLTGIESSVIVAIGILLSFVFGLYPSKLKNYKSVTKSEVRNINTRPIYRFMMVTAGYELSQIIINNSDVLLVKHYFNDTDAGLYSALALIGRVVYFVAWMFVMLLLPKVVQKNKNNEKTKPLLFKYMSMIAVLSFVIVCTCYFAPNLIITLMFGSAYLSMAPLLWQYAVATSLFALANIFAYYFLSLDQYLPVVLSGLFGLLQVFLVVFFHNTLYEVVHVQIIAMAILLFAQLAFFLLTINGSKSKGLR